MYHNLLSTRIKKMSNAPNGSTGGGFEMKSHWSLVISKRQSGAVEGLFRGFWGGLREEFRGWDGRRRGREERVRLERERKDEEEGSVGTFMTGGRERR